MPKYITQEGLEKLKKELVYLKETKRQEIADRLRRAIAFGDLSENFEYANARDEQAFVEGRISELEDIIIDSKIVSSTPVHSDTVQIGSQVTLKDSEESATYTITGPQEANPMEGKISAESPLGKALLGKKKGDQIKVETPAGKIEYSIIAIS